MEFDSHTILDCVVILVTAFSAYENMRMKVEIANLKLWIMENFEERRHATRERKV